MLTTSSPYIFYHYAGCLSFEKSLIIQARLKQLAKKNCFCFFGFESSQPVISLGLSANESHVLWSETKLKTHNISCKQTRRGGEATLHAPGQLIIYPVLALDYFNFKVKDFILNLESCTQKLLQSWNIPTTKQGKLAGLYAKQGKIAFFGIHISEGISQQGLSINVNNDLNLFHSIKSCGEQDRAHDKISFYHNKLNTKEVFFKWCDINFQALNQRRSIVQKKDVSSNIIF